MQIAADTEVGITTEGNTVSWSDISDAVRHVREHLTLRLTTGACATRLLYELAGHWCRMPQSFGGEPLLVDVHAVIDQIGEMECAQNSRAVATKAASRFDTGPLEGLWHKHWFQASFMPQNLANEMEKHGESLIIKRLIDRYGRDGWGSRTIDKEMVGLLAHASVFGALEHRTGNARRGGKSRLTGEWVVFAKSEGRNIYLTLGGHEEPNEAILDRCLPAVREFRELATTKPFTKFK
jgi:hypothetical protein